VAASLPETIRVKLSSEAAGGVSITPVVVREMPLRDLVEWMLDLTGKNAARLRELLLGGTLVSGASRFRWAALEAGVESLEALLATFPDPEPERPFAPERCIRVRIEGPGRCEDIPREALARRRFLSRSSFWDILVEVAAEVGLRYAGYFYRERADRYVLEIPPAQLERMQNSARLLRYSSLEAHMRAGSARELVFLVRRRDD
jgi:hypothetical protein